MRILTPSVALALGLALAPAAALAQASQSPVPPPNPKAAVTGQAPGTVGSGANNSMPVGGPGATGTKAPTSVGAGANNSVPVGGPGVKAVGHGKTHKRSHHKLYGKHYNYVRGGTKKGPTATHHKVTGTVD